MDTAGKRLKQFRKINKLTQKKLAEILYMEWYQIKDMEAGKVAISKQIAKLLYYETGLNYNWLLTGKGEMILNGEGMSADKNLKSADKTPPNESDMQEKLKQLEARMSLVERILTESRPEPGRRFYDPLVAEKK